ncbi:Hypothetical protein GLP15_1081 [Giardia lamblia P15]|uniref:Bromo domain-containing protein n=1 Tax=Giardia intestinalis (strain P15) TaxID=658858 RepID=E1F2L9_GIAIA|nr:Hypothetical protein GLP15_1081 [Giardia lamblia P15]
MLQRRGLSCQDPDVFYDFSGVIVRNFIVHGHQIHGVGFTPLQLLRKHYLVSASDDGAVKLWYVQGPVVRLVGYLISPVEHHSRIIDLAISQEHYIIAMWMDIVIVWDIPLDIGDGPEIYCSHTYISSSYLRTAQPIGKKNSNFYVNQLEKLLTIKDTPFAIVQSSAIIFLVCIATGDTAIIMELTTSPTDAENNRIVWACINESSTELAIAWTANGLPFITILKTSSIKTLCTDNGSFSLFPWKYISIDGQTLVRGEVCGAHLTHFCIEAPQTEWGLSSVPIFPKYIQYAPNDLLLVVSFHNMSCLLAYSTSEYRSSFARLDISSFEDASLASPGSSSSGHQILPFPMVRDLKPWCLTLISVSVVSYCEANTSYWSCTSFFFSPDSRYLAAQVKCSNTKFSKNYLVFFDLALLCTCISVAPSLALLEQQMVTDEAHDRANEFPLGADESFIERKVSPISRVILCGCGFGISICCLDLSNHPYLNSVVSTASLPPLPYVWVVSDTMNLENTGLRFLERNGEELPLTISPLDLFLFFLSPDGTQNIWNIRMPCSSQDNEGLVFSDICLSSETGELFVSNVTGQIMSISIGATFPPSHISPQEQFMFFELPGIFGARYGTDPDESINSALTLSSLLPTEQISSSTAQPLMIKGSKAVLNVTGMKMFYEELVTSISKLLLEELAVECHFSDDSCLLFDSPNQLKQSISKLEAKQAEGCFVVSVYCIGRIDTIFRYTLHNALITYLPNLDLRTLNADHMLKLSIKAPKSMFTGLAVYDTVRYLANYENPLAICSFYGTVYSIPASLEENWQKQPLSYLEGLSHYYKKVQKHGYHGFYERVISTRSINEIPYLDLGIITPKCASLNAMILCQPANEFLLDRASSKFLLLENVTTLKDVKQREKIELISDLLNTSEPLFATDVSGFIVSSNIELQTKQVKEIQDDNTDVPNDMDNYIAHIEAAISSHIVPSVPRRVRNPRRHLINKLGSGESEGSLLSISSLGADELVFESESDMQEQEEESCASISSSVSESGTYGRSTKDNDSEESLSNPGRKQKRRIKDVQDTDSFVYSSSGSGSVAYSEEIETTEDSILEKNTRKETVEQSKAEPPLKRYVEKVTSATALVKYTKVFLSSQYKTLIKRNVEFMRDFASPTPLPAGKANSYAVPQVGDAILVLPVHYRYSIQFIDSFFDKRIIGSTIAVLDRLIGPPPETGFYGDALENPNNKPYLAIIKDIYPQYWSIDKGRPPFAGMSLTLLTILIKPVTSIDQITPLITPDYELLDKLLANERTKNTYNLHITKSHDLVILPLSHSLLLEPRNLIPEFPILPYWSGAYHLRTLSKVLGQWIRYIREGPCASEQVAKCFKASFPSLTFTNEFYGPRGLEYCDLLEDTLLTECLNYPVKLSILPPATIQDIRKIKTIPDSFPLEAYHRTVPFTPASEHMLRPQLFTLTSRGNIVLRANTASKKVSESKISGKTKHGSSSSSTSDTDSDSSYESEDTHFQRKHGYTRKLVLSSVQHISAFFSNTLKKTPYFYSPRSIPRLLTIQTAAGDGSPKRWGDHYIPHAFGLLYHLFLKATTRTDTIKIYSAEALFREHVLDAFFPDAPSDNLTKRQLSKIELEESKSYLVSVCYQLYRDNTFASGLYYFTEDVQVPRDQTQEEIVKQASVWDNIDAQSATFSVETCARIFSILEDLYIRDTNILTYIPASLFSLSLNTSRSESSSSQSPVSPLYPSLVTELVPYVLEVNKTTHTNVDFSFVSPQNTVASTADSSCSTNNDENITFAQIIRSLAVRPFGIKLDNMSSTHTRLRKSSRSKQEHTLTFDGVFNPMSILSRMRLFLILVEAINITLTTPAYRDILFETFANPCSRIKRYAGVVAHPLWFNLIMHRVATGYYTCFRALINDIRIIAGNWDSFNGDQTIAICAEFCEKLIENLLLLVRNITALTDSEYQAICESVRFESSQSDDQDEKSAEVSQETEEVSSSSVSSSDSEPSDDSSSPKPMRNRTSARQTRRH